MTTIAELAPSVRRNRIRPEAAAGFLVVHLLALGVFFIGFSWQGVLLCVASYYVRMFGVTAGFHRYFSHRTFRLNRFWQFMLAFLAQTSAQKGVLWWASNHRHHHRYSDMPEDIHSPMQRGFWWSHIGWILADDYQETDETRVPDLAKFPELRWLNRHDYFATAVYAVALTAAFGWTGLFYGYFLSTVLLWHGTFSINSVMHVFGRRVYETTDDSRNSFLFAIVTMGEGWHNNHHYFPGTAAQGFRWWQVDASYYILRVARMFGIVRDLRSVPAAVVARAKPIVKRATVAVSTHVTLGERIDFLSAEWAAARDSAMAKAHSMFEDLEVKRAAAATRLEQLQREYADACRRAEAAASKRGHEIAAEIEKTRAHLAEVLESLVARVRSAELSAQPA